ncbi:MAG: hypothetical protein ACI9EK_002467 [Psychroserpens sp.]|jgi:hypothetical protein
MIEWENIIACSDNLDKFLDLDIDEESEKFMNKRIGVKEFSSMCD